MESTPIGRIPRKERKEPNNNSLTSQMDAPLTASRSEGDDQLAALKARIQEKKERLLKMKKVKGDGSSGSGNNSNESKDGGEGQHGGEATSLSNSELAAKNALRFASSNNNNSASGQPLSKLLPADLKDRDEALYHEGGSVEEEEDIDDLQIRTLRGAVDLIGVCRSMCPDEELLRREREGDIQLLEITDPGGLHPQGWTLRDTAVKRFRRSAADFKLDIPELVRPPDVLERVCGYLEEWVMERDRQGPDKRFAQQPSIVPPPLDVYQFIWDRTRMIRKDFILQNYIGDGGKCDARAVRCHERIARWHAMCEHQLSHIQEFVTHQSQQNIAELGQTMKTLNLYYDDALGRSLNEETGDSNVKEYAQGCASDIVMGKSPVDFNGSELSNSSSGEDVSKRIIGANGLKSSTRGTAEPEMRGLYILLTMNNEGGMEVIKYSGRLCTQRPEIFYSKPVQLALAIFQARKDHNYAKFFHLMSSPSTPYLFCCIMFKYVEQMRKTALTIMSKTYGAKHKTTGESFYDEYPLENLVKLLCYEDEEEAKAACSHYGITLEGNVIRWRNSKFAEPRDPVKGIILTLKPKKMHRTIESKLKGATRLSVCRGGVSGEGATLSSTERAHPSKGESSSQETELAASMAAERAKKEAAEKARQQHLLEQLEKQKREEARRKEEAAKKEAERKKQEEAKRKAQQLELKRQQKALEEKKRLEKLRQEELRLKKEKEEALLKEAREREAAKKRAEEVKQELARQQLLEKQRKEEELKRRLAMEAEQKRRQEEEARRKAEDEERRRIAHELKQKRLAEEARLRREREEEERQWNLKIESAKKILLWSLWLKELGKRQRFTNSAAALENLDPTVTCTSQFTSLTMSSVAYRHASLEMPTPRQSLENKIHQLATASREPCNLSKIIADSFLKSKVSSIVKSSPVPLEQPMLLFKLSVVLPERTAETDSLVNSLLIWADSHLQFDRVTYFISNSVKVKTVSTVGNEDSNLCSDCGAVLFLLPTFESSASVMFSEHVLDSVPDNLPRMILLIGDTENNVIYPEQLIDDVLGPECNSNNIPHLRNGVVIPSCCEWDSAFRKCCNALVTSSIETATNQPIIKIPLSKLSFLCIQQMLLNLTAAGLIPQLKSQHDALVTLYDHSMSTLATMVEELCKISDEIKSNKLSVWPAKQFLSKRSNSVENYFGEQGHLPRHWYLPLQNRDMLEDKALSSTQFICAPETFASFVDNETQKMPSSYQQQHLIDLLHESNFSGCFVEVVSLAVKGEIDVDFERMPTIYLPLNMMSKVMAISAHCAPSERLLTPEPLSIPDFLYDDHPCNYGALTHTTKDAPEEIENTPPPEQIENTPPMNKRKPPDQTSTHDINRNDQKRIRRAESNKVESEEMQSSKDFTSYLEALLG